MDILDRAYNRMELLAIGADEMLSGVRRRWDAWATYRKLSALDDRQLMDIGLSRREIERIVRGEVAAGRGAGDRALSGVRAA
jgi:uncharacterized protein YjiS (DUF1127 family)